MRPRAALADAPPPPPEPPRAAGPPPDVVPAEPPTATEWQLDFSSRPVLDERGKKRWELLITTPNRSWECVRWFSNNKINSAEVTGRGRVGWG